MEKLRADVGDLVSSSFLRIFKKESKRLAVIGAVYCLVYVFLSGGGVGVCVYYFIALLVALIITSFIWSYVGINKVSFDACGQYMDMEEAQIKELKETVGLFCRKLDVNFKFEGFVLNDKVGIAGVYVSGFYFRSFLIGFDSKYYEIEGDYGSNKAIVAHEIGHLVSYFRIKWLNTFLEFLWYINIISSLSMLIWTGNLLFLFIFFVIFYFTYSSDRIYIEEEHLADCIAVKLLGNKEDFLELLEKFDGVTERIRLIELRDM
ncbi:hypothetical protein ACFL3M_02665 [Patescibacteria group bacterium]